MADISITAANVATVSGGQYEFGVAGVTITAGQWVYSDSTTNTIKLADANATVLTANAVGVALHGSLAGQPIRFQSGGDITIGGTLTQGEIYVLSDTAGGMAPRADLTTGWYTKVLGIALSTTVLTIINRGPSTLVLK